MKHTRLTYDEHVEIGGKLKKLRSELMEITVRLRRAHGSTSPVIKAADRAMAGVNDLRNRLDSQLCASLPPSDESWRGVYYGENRH